MSIFETSESASSILNKPQLKTTDYKFIRITDPVPCTICLMKLKTRPEQIEHYHSDEHIKLLREKCTQKTGEVWRKTYTNDEELEIVNIDLDNANEISNFSNVQALVYRCGCCDQTFNSEPALKNHLSSKKHKKNSGDNEVEADNMGTLTEAIE